MSVESPNRIHHDEGQHHKADHHDDVHVSACHVESLLDLEDDYDSTTTTSTTTGSKDVSSHQKSSIVTTDAGATMPSPQCREEGESIPSDNDNDTTNHPKTTTITSQQSINDDDHDETTLSSTSDEQFQRQHTTTNETDQQKHNQCKDAASTPRYNNTSLLDQEEEIDDDGDVNDTTMMISVVSLTNNDDPLLWDYSKATSRKSGNHIDDVHEATSEGSPPERQQQQQQQQQQGITCTTNTSLLDQHTAATCSNVSLLDQDSDTIIDAVVDENDTKATIASSPLSLENNREETNNGIDNSNNNDDTFWSLSMVKSPDIIHHIDYTSKAQQRKAELDALRQKQLTKSKAAPLQNATAPRLLEFQELQQIRQISRQKQCQMDAKELLHQYRGDGTDKLLNACPSPNRRSLDNSSKQTRKSDYSRHASGEGEDDRDVLLNNDKSPSRSKDYWEEKWKVSEHPTDECDVGNPDHTKEDIFLCGPPERVQLDNSTTTAASDLNFDAVASNVCQKDHFPSNQSHNIHQIGEEEADLDIVPAGIETIVDTGVERQWTNHPTHSHANKLKLQEEGQNLLRILIGNEIEFDEDIAAKINASISNSQSSSLGVDTQSIDRQPDTLDVLDYEILNVNESKEDQDGQPMDQSSNMPSADKRLSGQLNVDNADDVETSLDDTRGISTCSLEDEIQSNTMNETSSATEPADESSQRVMQHTLTPDEVPVTPDTIYSLTADDDGGSDKSEGGRGSPPCITARCATNTSQPRRRTQRKNKKEDSTTSSSVFSWLSAGGFVTRKQHYR